MDSSLPQEEAKEDEIPSNDAPNLGDSGQVNNQTPEENKNEEEEGKAESITNSIASNLLPAPTESEKDNNNIEKSDTNVDNSEKINNPTSKENNKEDVEKAESITNSIADNLLTAPVESENNNKIDDEENKEDDNNSNQNNEDDQIDNERNDETNSENKTENEDNNKNKPEEEDINNDENSMINFSQTFSDEDVQYAFDQLYENGKIPETSMFPQLLQVIFREKANAIDNQNYDRAKKLEHMISSINRESDSYSYSYSMTPESQSRYLNDRDSRLHQQLEDTKAKYKVKLDNHTKDCQNRMQQLQEKQQLEVSELKTKYQDPSFLMRFNRPSQQLLSMRKCERKLALARKYEEARQIKRLADNQQKREEKEMQDAVQQSMQSEYIKLIEKQKRDMDRMLQFDKKMEKEIKVAKQKELTPIKRAIQQTAIKKINNEAKRPVFYPLSSSSLSTSNFAFSLGSKNYNPELARDSMAKNQTLPTPRTLSKMKLLKIQNKVELNVEPIDDSTFAKLEQMNQRRVKSLLPKL